MEVLHVCSEMKTLLCCFGVWDSRRHTHTYIYIFTNGIKMTLLSLWELSSYYANGVRLLLQQTDTKEIMSRPKFFFKNVQAISLVFFSSFSVCASIYFLNFDFEFWLHAHNVCVYLFLSVSLVSSRSISAVKVI